jgi:hypothetical protein
LLVVHWAFNGQSAHFVVQWRESAINRWMSDPAAYREADDPADRRDLLTPIKPRRAD